MSTQRSVAPPSQQPPLVNPAATSPTTIPPMWLCVLKYNQISVYAVATLNGVLGIILTLISSLTTDPNIQRLVAIGFGVCVALLNLIIHFILQVLIVATSNGPAQEQQEEAFINNAGPIPDNTPPNAAMV